MRCKMKKVLLLFLGILSILTYILFKNDQYFPTIVEAKPFKNEFNESYAHDLYEIIKNVPEFRNNINNEELDVSIKEYVLLLYLNNRSCMEYSLFSKELFITTFEKIFGEIPTDLKLCEEKEQKYECNVKCDELIKPLSEYIKYEKTDKEIIIYEKSGFLFQFDDNKKYLKINIDDIESIAVFSKKEVIDINKYLEQLNTYKHVFKIEKNRYIWSYSEKQS